MVIQEPAASVRVSEVESATTFDCPLTAIVENKLWSQVFVPLVFPITVNCASVTYLLLEESAISAVVASAPAVTNHLVSYVILVFVAHTIATFSSTFQSRAVCVAVDTGLLASLVLSTFHRPTSEDVTVTFQDKA